MPRKTHGSLSEAAEIAVNGRANTEVHVQDQPLSERSTLPSTRYLQLVSEPFWKSQHGSAATPNSRERYTTDDKRDLKRSGGMKCMYFQTRVTGPSNGNGRWHCLKLGIPTCVSRNRGHSVTRYHGDGLIRGILRNGSAITGIMQRDKLELPFVLPCVYL
jgi:hypothetical protein